MLQTLGISDAKAKSDAQDKSVPLVSILMPTFKQEDFIRRAIDSVCAQTFAAWELIIVNDGSTDRTHDLVSSYLTDRRIRYHVFQQNQGVGAALNFATTQARGEYIAYLPSDDLYYREHLATLIGHLEAHQKIYLVYGGVCYGHGAGKKVSVPTLLGPKFVNREAEALSSPLRGNLLTLVQLVHRRHLEERARWKTRREVVSDNLETEFLRTLLANGARFAYADKVTCEWVDHPDQRHKIISASTDQSPAWMRGSSGRGLHAYRNYYGVRKGEWLRWQPSRGAHVDEYACYGHLDRNTDLPAPGGLKILLVGDLGWNPERILAFEERGHKLYGLWIPWPNMWNAVGPFPYGNVEDIAYDRAWPDRVRSARPDLIYALLNIHSLPLINEVLDAHLGIPVVFHFKEQPFWCQSLGWWPTLLRILLESDGQVFISQENFEWYQLATGGVLDPSRVWILDGDLPKLNSMTDDWAPKLSAQDGKIHTVCAGRPVGLEPFQHIAKAGIHVHFYGEHFQDWNAKWVESNLPTRMLHIHPAVESHRWTEELSKYDAGWLHVFESSNGGELQRASWDDLNLPARLSTYAAAGLPWIMRDNGGSCVATQNLALKYDIGLLFHDFSDLARQLRDHSRLSQLTSNMRNARHAFSFDSHVSSLTDFFRRVISGAGSLDTNLQSSD